MLKKGISNKKIRESMEKLNPIELFVAQNKGSANFCIQKISIMKTLHSITKKVQKTTFKIKAKTKRIVTQVFFSKLGI